MNPDYQNQPELPQPAVNNPLSIMQPGERVICDIKRHPFGILTIFLAEGLLLIVLAVLSLVIAPNVLGGNNRDLIMSLGGVFFFIFAVVSLAFVFIANVVYWGNRWVVTSDSITQVKQTGLFHKQSSQLSFGNLEDVTSEQNGVLAQLFRFGTLRAETAGENSKFIFVYCPNPNYFAQKILAAREVFEQSNRGKDELRVATLQPSPDNQQIAYNSPPVPEQPNAEPQPVYPSQPPVLGQPPQSPSQQSEQPDNKPTGSDNVTGTPW